MVLWKTYSNWTPFEAHLDQNTKSKMLKLQNVGEHIEGTHGWGEAIVLKSMWGKFMVGGVCTTIFDKVLDTAVKDLAHTSSEHVLYFKLEKAATVRTTVFLSVGVFWFPYSWSVTASNSCSVTAPTRTW